MTRWSDIDRTLEMMDELRRRMGWLFYDQDQEQERDRGRGAFRALYEDLDRYSPVRAATSATSATAWPAVNLYDAGTNLVVEADVPGLSEKDVRLSIHLDVLTLSGERKGDAPEGYAAHRRERAPVKFSRSFALPCKVDAEKTTARLKDGVLTITMAKVPEAQPRQIQVQSQ